MKRFLLYAVCFVIAAAIVIAKPFVFQTPVWGEDDLALETGMFQQKAVRALDDPATIYRLYDEGKLVGILSDPSALNRFLAQVYEEQYAEDYPQERLVAGDGISIVKEQSFFVYSNADEAIFSYLLDNNCFALSCTEISIADDTDVFARFYVQNEEIYQEALNQFLSLFIDEETRALLTSGKKTAELTEPGTRVTGLSIAETITVEEGYAPADEIMRDSDAVFDYLCYGDHVEKEYYTIEEGDTLAGVGAKNNGLTGSQIALLNRDVLLESDGELIPGEELCVTYFTSPLTVTLTREVLREEVIYPETMVVQDESLAEDERRIVQDGITGSENVLYTETWTNGVLVRGSEVSARRNSEPVEQIVHDGSDDPEQKGTGLLEWPCDNPAVICESGCYAGQTGALLINRYDRYGDVLASDNGVISDVGWDSAYGYYVIIDHKNGLSTYYGSMNAPCPLSVGTVVQKGDVIGEIGMSGSATGPHLYFAILSAEEIMDPCMYLPCRGYEQ